MKEIKNETAKTGFTLAEVLITLVIIGVIAALTVPTLIQNTQKQEYVSALKKAYSTLSQAAQMIIAEEGSPKCDEGGWACSLASVRDLFRSRMNTLKICETTSQCVDFNSYKGLRGDHQSVLRHIGGSFGNYGFVTADGAAIFPISVVNQCNASDYAGYWTGAKNWCALFIVDTNGAKAPNTYGRDVHQFILKENGIYPAGCEANFCNGYGDASNGAACACKVLREGAMNY